MSEATAVRIVGDIVALCRAENRSPLSALSDVATCATQQCPDRLADWLCEWLNTKGEPTFDKLLAWSWGLESGFKSAARKMSHLPSIHGLLKNDRFGVVVIEHRHSDKAFMVPFSEGTRAESQKLANDIKKEVDSRDGVWIEDTVYAFQRV